MEIKIRKLKTGDLYAVVDMLSKVSGAAGRELAGLFVSDESKPAANDGGESNDQYMRIGMLVLETCYKHTREDLINWFADLIGKTTEEYLATPINTTLDIIEQLAGAEESKDFFSRAWRMYSTMRGSAGQLSEKLGS